jgi:arylsulfatase A-like enzyme
MKCFSQFPALLCALCILCGKSPSAALAASPNVLVILADDMGWGDLSSNGNTNLSTPNLDALRAAGASFDRFFVQPVCSPTRAEFLTGRYHPRGGVRGVSSGAERLDLDEKTTADAFRAAGYATACFGKWHNGSQFPYHPNGRGFDEFYGFTHGHWANYFDAPMDHNGRAVRGKGYLPDDITAHAIDFMTARHAEQKPFFCYVAFNIPHSPMQVPDRFWQKFATADFKLRGTRPGRENLPHTRAALAMVENLDWNVGRLLDALAAANARDNTIVMFFTDNGPNGPRFNGGMKGVKGTTDEGGVRSPLFIAWPSRIRPGSTVTPIAAVIDLYPTLAGLADVAPPTEAKSFDGNDLSPLLIGANIPLADRVLIQHWNGQTSARNQRFRLDSEGRLYDIIADPGQHRDVAAGHPQIVAALRSAINDWRREVLAEAKDADDRPFPVGYPQQPIAELPARDGVPRSNIRRSARPPNASYFTNWKSTDDSVSWPIEIATPGRYEAIIDYACPVADLGAQIELTCGEARWTASITDAHDPPPHGAEHDRVLRGESYAKDFRPLSLGMTTLNAGRATLTLRATKIPSRQAAEFSAVKIILRH